MKEMMDSYVKEFLKTHTVLCVDDNKTDLALYGLILKPYVGSILYAKNGEEAFEIFKSEKVDIILTDYEMPLMDGLSFIKKVRRERPQIPIYLITSLCDAEILKEALNLNVTAFIAKPVKKEEILFRIEESSKIIIANDYILEEKNRKIAELQKREEYVEYQQELAFQKELNILRNDFYYKMIDFDNYQFIDFSYRPLDILSGDAYSVRYIQDRYSFFLLVDGMGKGISASFSTILLITCVNKIINEAKKFDFEYVIESSMRFIQTILLEYETISVDFVLYDTDIQKMSYAKFGMPSFLFKKRSGEVVKIKSNNPPMSKYTSNFRIYSYDVSDVDKMLFYTDGLPENSTNISNKIYNEFLEDDFSSALTKRDMQNAIDSKISIQEDDMTFIFISKLDRSRAEIYQESFESSFEEIDRALSWYEALWQKYCKDSSKIAQIQLIFNELYMNAFEHGNLNIGMDEKAFLMEEGRLEDELLIRSKKCTKKIDVRVMFYTHKRKIYVITSIVDEGDGFDTKILEQIFRNKKGLRNSFSGRGILMSKKASCGIYYNQKGNGVIFVESIESSDWCFL